LLKADGDATKNPGASGLPWIDFGREISSNLYVALQREWLVTNGLGGFASGAMPGLLTRRYHGLLVATLDPPLGRTLLVAKVEEIASYNGQAYSLSANRWAGGAIEPQGYRFLDRFRLEGTMPVWTFACADALLEKRVWMEHGANTTYVRYELVRAGGPMRLTVKVLVNYRDFHATTHAGNWRMEIQPVEHGLRVTAFEGATPFYLLSADAEVEAHHDWYRNFDLAVERERGLDDREDHLHAANFLVALDPGDSATLILSTDHAPDLDGPQALERSADFERSLLERWATVYPALSEAAPPWVRQLVLAADQFIVRRSVARDPDSRTIIAGYHWFGDWGRDTMVALPGLTLSTGRPEVARPLLRTFARFADRGMLPNYFPESGQSPEYSSVDAALWFFDALRQYHASTRDTDLLRELFPLLAEIIHDYAQGTRHRIRVDPQDGLLYAGEPGVQLTWMDAKADDWAVTPRAGKPIEVNALWFNALITMADWARILKRSPRDYQKMAEHARVGFSRFWNETAASCFDVLDGPQGNDASLRPNQIFAVSLPESPLTPGQQRAVVDACARRLLTSCGLRSLAPDDPHYRGSYVGPPRDRDSAYHQGTVWGWLLGPFVLAHLRVYKDPVLAASFLEPMAQHLGTYGLGTAGEIFDGDPPFAPRGCIAQAWTVGELLRAWTTVKMSQAKTRGPRANVRSRN
jgi:predicted glycogen debranching enzyme